MGGGQAPRNSNYEAEFGELSMRLSVDFLFKSKILKNPCYKKTLGEFEGRYLEKPFYKVAMSLYIPKEE